MKTKLTFMIAAIVAVIACSYQKTIAQNTSPYWSLAGNSNATSTSKLGTTNAINLRLLTNNAERMRITTTGNVGIGTTNPTERLHINSASGTNALRVQVNGSTKLLVHKDGGVSIGSYVTPPANGLYVSGNVGIGTGAASWVRLRVEGGDDGSDGDGYGGSAIYASGGDYGVVASGVGAGVSATGDYFGVQGEASFGSGVDGRSTDGDGGSFYSGNGNGIYAGTSYGNYAAYFDGAVYASAGFVTSDKNLKKDIREFGNAMSIIKQLKPRNYEFSNNQKYASLNLPKGNHYGLIAQDLEEVLPNLVKESPHEIRDIKPITAVKSTADGKPSIPPIEKKETINIKAVNYIELIPILIKAMQEQETKMQEQSATIEKQNTKIEALTQLVNKLSQNPNAAPSVKLTSASLGQSTPNPNSTSTRIIYSIPSGFSRAELVINNEAGQKVKQMQLNKSGLIDIDTSGIRAGTYFYTLYLDGKSIDTKKMIVVR